MVLPQTRTRWTTTATAVRVIPVSHVPASSPAQPPEDRWASFDADPSAYTSSVAETEAELRAIAQRHPQENGNGPGVSPEAVASLRVYPATLQGGPRTR